MRSALRRRLGLIEAAAGIGRRRIMHVVAVPHEDPANGAELSDEQRSALAREAVARAGVTIGPEDDVVLLLTFSSDGTARLLNSFPLPR